jgi:TatD DNase family protein
LQDAVRDLPLSRILLETDAPFLAPAPFRGKVNEPAFIPYIAEKISEIKQVSVKEVEDVTTDNFLGLFKKAEIPEISF